MDDADAWHFLMTRGRDVEVTCGECRVRITVTDDGWRTDMRRGDVRERAEGTHTHDLLVYLAHALRNADEPAAAAHGEAFTTPDGLWIAGSSANSSFSTSDGQRRLHVYDDTAAFDMVDFMTFQTR